MREDLRKLGADAARQGLGLLDCPYFRAGAMPAHTGESISEWSRCVQAWEMGWREATAQRLARCDRAAMLGALTHNH
ncbi:MAG: hypothetical protein J0I68_01320 [Achromobacter sp.]|jgi:hypothetical protein|uniref:Ribosome modulation factor n=1 Tax=Achromobacter insuavis TaxID=1287735 RepID=A0A6J5HSK3_9BURK|nr:MULTISPECIES: CrpP-related protein [Achromobacter]MBN9637144.1 hypothetical protein [Achromobacter sp.]CAB3641748.1 hypothetical protein LMG26845_02108 [Achromobacter insuavis]CAB3849469.1 hypothetical protein LMG26846_01913 [Achromobacter insuavis]CUI30834.1 Uncharacterised protein [Achromobacter sp. 2789STDY5608621]CUI82389.1 Uncharacterised protein [Achromobacter sp. 2789STDY5608628]